MPNPLIELVRRHTDARPESSPFATAIKGLTLLRSDRARQPAHLIFKPALCVVVQGSKWSTFGDRRLVYPPGQALVVSVEMPALSKITHASPDEPYLGIVIEFDPAVMSEVLETFDAMPGAASKPARGVFVTHFDGPLSDCVLRMVRLLDTPQAIPVIAPMIMREISYWLLSGPHGGEVARLALSNGHARRVVNAVSALREQFNQAIRIDDLAAIAQLSPSAFHRQFKALTSMTPLQFQKQLRLLEARHLLAAGRCNVEGAALQVGYESPSQFNREYARMFGAPPRRDITALRAAAIM